MSRQRQKKQPEPVALAFPEESRGDAPKATAQGTETLAAKRQSESLAGTEGLMEEACELETCELGGEGATPSPMPIAVSNCS
jgi:hypothetical protein